MRETKSFDELRALCEHIHGVIREYGKIYHLRSEPERLAARIKRVKACADQDEAAAAIVRAAIATIAEAERQRAEEASATAIAALAVEIEMIRAALPTIAAKAAIELGVVAREIRALPHD